MTVCRCLLAAALLLPGAAQGQSAPTTAADPAALPLYGDQTPGTAASEISGGPVGHRMLRNVTRPTLTPFLPAPGKGNGAAVVVAPGGAFMGLAIDDEGMKVARALAARGIAAFVLKYRLIPTPVPGAEAMHFTGEMMKREIGNPMEGALLRRTKAPDDARAALAMVRARAAGWHLDPARVGIIGFSAGAMTARRVALDTPPAGRPAFVGYIYGPQDPETVPADAPPLFDAIALDDQLFANKGFPIAQAWLAAKRPIEIHGYQKGGHGVGLGSPGRSTGLVLDEVVTWLGTNGFLAGGAG